MSPSDPKYLVFLAIVAIALPFVPAGRYRLAALSLIGLAFYMGFNAAYGPLLIAVTMFTFAAGKIMDRLAIGRARTAVFCAAFVIALSPLLIFKYFGAFAGLAGLVRGSASWGLLDLALPIGISFYTFQAVGYIIDVFVGNIEAERSMIRFAAFLCFFPVLPAGPIERAPHLLPQLENVGVFQYARCVSGLRLILIGFFMKVVIADNLAPLVDRVYATPTAHGALDLALATVFFSFQVYADFAGYSLIAIGSARLLGIELLPNFAQPYLSQTLPEFWRTWHMTLSAWFRDYVFTPLQFQWRRRGRLGLAAALIITFIIVGVWHGAGWKYAIFGLIHGLLVSWSVLTLKARDRYWKRVGVPPIILGIARTVLTFSIVTLTFVLFRASSVQESLWIYQTLVSGTLGSLSLPLGWPVVMIGTLIAYDLAARRGWFALLSASSTLRWAAYHAATIGVLVSLGFRLANGSGNAQHFIYFKF